MKTKLTLNIDSDVVKKAKRISSRKRESLSSAVESFLMRYAEKPTSKQPAMKESLTERIRKLTRPVKLTDERMKSERDKFLQKKYGN